MAMNKPPISGGESPFLFIQSTISKDESQGLASKEVRTLAAANPPLTGLPPSSIGPPPMNPQFRNPPPGPGPPSLSRKREQTQLLALESMDPDTHDNIGSHDGNNSFLSTITSSKEREGMWREALRSERKDPVQNLTSRPSDGPDAQCHTSLKEGRQTLEPNTGTVKPDLAVALGLVADNYLSLDVLDGRRDVSKYIAFLLDTIHNLQTKLAYRTSEESTPAPEAIAPREQESSSLIKPHPQILHRVFCAASHHSHDAMVYEDEPVVTKKTEGLCRGEEVVCGTIEVPDVDAYLRKHPSISFVVFKEYRCIHDIPASGENENCVTCTSEGVTPGCRMQT
ncbi:hypothetical protein F4779DRAFT_635143 [Xylariaceae sp. FL0662B]|nr:hypothetical protein F4779DRAFT_635143 [Xylariaceae sp. FL0662B]